MTDKQKKIYNHLVAALQDGKEVNTHEGNIPICLRMGLNGKSIPKMFGRQSIGYAAWKAGKEYRKSLLNRVYKGVIITYDPITQTYSADDLGDGFKNLKEVKFFIKDFIETE